MINVVQLTSVVFCLIDFSSPFQSLAQLMSWYNVCHPYCWPSFVHQLFYLNNFFSITTGLFSTKIGRKQLFGKDIQICSNSGFGPLRGLRMNQK